MDPVNPTCRAGHRELCCPLVKVRIERVQSISEADAWAEGYGDTLAAASQGSGRRWSAGAS